MAWKRRLNLPVFLILFGATFTLAGDTGYELEIARNGSAQLRRAGDPPPVPIWTVTCAPSETACLAQSLNEELSLSLDSSGKAWLHIATSAETRVFLQRSNLTQPRADLVNRPLSARAIADLSHADAKLLIEEKGLIVLRSQTAGLAHVVNYLTWLNSGGAVAIGDARLWPGRAGLTAQPQDIPTLDPLRESAEKNRALPSFVPPFTKPQIEFAIRSQSKDLAD
jgi:hypothetical protein